MSEIEKEFLKEKARIEKAERLKKIRKLNQTDFGFGL